MGPAGEKEIRASASAHYSAGDAIWLQGDRWNEAKRQQIDRFCRQWVERLVTSSSRVLNCGAGSHHYDWMPPQTVAVDRFPAQLVGVANAVVGDVETLPFPDQSFDIVICVGSVLNYVSGIEALSELGRVLQHRGYLLLHFESSDSLEHLGSSRWRADAAPLATINNGKDDLIWVYSPDLVWRTLGRWNLRVVEWHGFHLASAALLRLGFSQEKAARAQCCDWLLRPLKALSDDIILVAQKG